MAKLVEGMTRGKTDYGTVIHFYRGVKIYKRSSGYEYRIQYMQPTTGQIYTRDRHAAYQLQNVPLDIDRVLDDNNGAYYFVNEIGIVCLTPDYKKELLVKHIERTEAEIAEMTNKITSLLAAQNFVAVEQGAGGLVRAQAELLSLKSNL